MAQAMDALRRHNELVRTQLLSQLLQMPPGDFESRVAVLLEHLGFRDVLVTGSRGDGGVDITARSIVAGGLVEPVPFLVQVKRWKRNVPVEIVRELRGCLAPGQHALLVTTANFTTAARAEASAAGKVQVVLLNGREVVEALIAHKIGVRRHALYAWELEPDNTDAVRRHDPLTHTPRSPRTPSGRAITVSIADHFTGTSEALLPTFSVLAGAAVGEAPDVDYFALKDHIVFVRGADGAQHVVMLVEVQKTRLRVRLRLPDGTTLDERLTVARDTAFRALRHVTYAASPSEVDARLRRWVKLAFSQPQA